MPDVYTVTITNFSDGGQLGCTTSIAVDYTIQNGGEVSMLTLTTSAASAMITPGGFQVNAGAGTKTFSVTFPPGTSQTGKTVTAAIIIGSVTKASDQKSNISVSCPQAETDTA